MATLTGNTVQSTYKSLIKINDNSELNATTPENLTDGLGNIMPLQVSQNQIKFTGILDADSATSILGLDAPKNIIVDGVGTWSATTAEDTVIFSGSTGIDIGLAGDTLTWTFDGGALGYATEGYVDTAVANLSASAATDISANTTNIASLAAGTGNVIGVRSNANAYIAGNVTLQQGSNVTLSQAGNIITINSTGGGGGGSDSFNTIASTGLTSIVAASGNDTLNIEKVANQGITFATDNTTKTFTIGTDNSVLAYRSYVDPVVNGLASGITDLENGVGNVTSFNTLTGDVTLTAGPGITLNPVGNDIEISSSVSGVTINNNTNNNILTATGTANTIEGEPLFTYDSTTGTVGLYSSATNGLQLDAGTVPSANPTIGSSGFFTQLEFSSNVITSNDIIIRDQGKIAFDTDPTNTYIAANASTPEDLEIHADQDLHLLPDGNVGIGTTTPTNKLHVVGNTFTSANFIGDGLVVGSINYNKQISIQTPSTTFPAQGELSPIAGTGLTAGGLYYLNSSGVWTVADATAEASCKNMLGIAISATEVMIRGHLSYTAYAGFTDGEPLYVKPSGTGDITNIVPSTSGHIVRKIGFCLDGSARSIYFNPSNDYFEVE